MKQGRPVMLTVFNFMPTTLISRLFGMLTRIPLPSWILNRIIEKYSKAFKVNKEEYIVPQGGFKNFNHFFTRKLKDEAREIEADPRKIISPVDGRIDSFGIIKKDTMIQAKGIKYSLQDLVPGTSSKDFIDGSYITLYLSPGDYHRIHSPVQGVIRGYLYAPGRLFTVQEYMVQSTPGLFTKNERLITFIKTDIGSVAVCKIGAMNVGRIGLSYDKITSNSKAFRTMKEIHYPEDRQIPVRKGDEIGVFNMGSTVICLFPYNKVEFNNLKQGSSIKLGEVIGSKTK